ncbi:MAG: acetolactate synthase small subunit [Kiritimatiellia bacterium]
MKHIVTLLVENKPGVLARVVGLISGRGYNIDGLTVAPTLDPEISKMTIEVPGDDRVIEQVTKQCNKLIDVIKVTDLTAQRFIGQELVLVKVAVGEEQRGAVMDLAGVFGAKVILVQPNSLVMRLVEEQEKIRDFLELMKPYRVQEVNRSGLIAMAAD